MKMDHILYAAFLFLAGVCVFCLCVLHCGFNLHRDKMRNVASGRTNTTQY